MQELEKAKLKKRNIVLSANDNNFWLGHIEQNYKTIVANPGYHWYNKITKEHFGRYYELAITFFDENNKPLAKPIYEQETNLEQVPDFNIKTEFEDFKKDLLNSKIFFEHILKNHNVVAILIGGSNAYDLSTENSDIDLVVFCKEGDIGQLYEETEFLLYRGKKIHWFYDSLTRFKNLFKIDLESIQLETQEFYYFTSLFFGLAVLNTDKVLWINQKEISYYNSKKEDFYKTTLLAAKSFLYLNKQPLLTIKKYFLTNDEIKFGFIATDEKFLKLLYRAYVCYCIYLNQTIDADFVRDIRHTTSKKLLSEEAIIKIIKIIDLITITL